MITSSRCDISAALSYWLKPKLHYLIRCINLFFLVLPQQCVYSVFIDMCMAQSHLWSPSADPMTSPADQCYPIWPLLFLDATPADSDPFPPASLFRFPLWDQLAQQRAQPSLTHLKRYPIRVDNFDVHVAEWSHVQLVYLSVTIHTNPSPSSLQALTNDQFSVTDQGLFWFISGAAWAKKLSDPKL